MSDRPATPASTAAWCESAPIMADVDPARALALDLAGQLPDLAAMARIRAALMAGSDVADEIAAELAAIATRAAYLHRLLMDAHDPSLGGIALDLLEDRCEVATATAGDVARALSCPGCLAWLAALKAAKAKP
jgi:hypothetical protein